MIQSLLAIQGKFHLILRMTSEMNINPYLDHREQRNSDRCRHRGHSRHNENSTFQFSLLVHEIFSGKLINLASQLITLTANVYILLRFKFCFV